MINMLNHIVLTQTCLKINCTKTKQIIRNHATVSGLNMFELTYTIMLSITMVSIILTYIKQNLSMQQNSDCVYANFCELLLFKDQNH